MTSYIDFQSSHLLVTRQRWGKYTAEPVRGTSQNIDIVLVRMSSSAAWAPHGLVFKSAREMKAFFIEGHEDPVVNNAIKVLEVIAKDPMQTFICTMDQLQRTSNLVFPGTFKAEDIAMGKLNGSAAFYRMPKHSTKNPNIIASTLLDSMQLVCQNALSDVLEWAITEDHLPMVQFSVERALTAIGNNMKLTDPRYLSMVGTRETLTKSGTNSWSLASQNFPGTSCIMARIQDGIIGEPFFMNENSLVLGINQLPERGEYLVAPFDQDAGVYQSTRRRSRDQLDRGTLSIDVLAATG